MALEFPGRNSNGIWTKIKAVFPGFGLLVREMYNKANILLFLELRGHYHLQHMIEADMFMMMEG